VYYEVGDYQTVIKLADNTLRNTKYVEETLYYRGLAYAALGSTAQAVSDLEASAAFNANVIQIGNALRALQSGQRPAPEFL
jgi:tetratricopeptide (TPR) repeat protein